MIESVYNTSGYAKNIYINLEGHICPTPFEMPCSGVWYFDGQVFYQKQG